MGIVNVTPDSFGTAAGTWTRPRPCVTRGLSPPGGRPPRRGRRVHATLCAGRAGRRGADPAPAGPRAAPAQAALPGVGGHVEARGGRGCAGAGAHMVNDVTGLAGGPELARVCARYGAGAGAPSRAGDAGHDADGAALRRSPPGGGRAPPARRGHSRGRRRRARRDLRRPGHRLREDARAEPHVAPAARRFPGAREAPSGGAVPEELHRRAPRRPAAGERLEGTLAACAMAVPPGRTSCGSTTSAPCGGRSGWPRPSGTPSGVSA